MNYYILKNGKLQKTTDIIEWAKSLSQRQIEKTKIGEILVSTVFLGLDHNLFRDVETLPILFETMVFGGKLDQFQWRYSTFGEAKRGHYEVVQAIKENREPELNFGQLGFNLWFKEMFGDGMGFDGEIPEELKPWFDSLKDKEDEAN